MQCFVFEHSERTCIQANVHGLYMTHLKIFIHQANMVEQ